MQFLDHTLASPAENLALDEALLLESEAGHQDECLRFWESATSFVVVGIGATVAHEVNWDRCRHGRIPVLRRCSGGGTVVQGPGCLNYALVLRIAETGALATIRSTNQLVMQRHASVLSALLGREVTVQGHTDLTLGSIKVSGNAQRRLRHHLLFHGTFLLNSDLSLIDQLLPLPKVQPEYRGGRNHLDFLQNLNLTASALKAALRHTWSAEETTVDLPAKRVASLVDERYGCAEWNLRR